MAIPRTDVGCALSEAYLQAIAHVAGYPCSMATRLVDNTGVDAALSINKDFGPNSLKDFDVKIQLKHTSSPATIKGGLIRHDIDIKTYDRFREVNTSNLYLLILLVLGPKPENWLQCTPTQLCIKGVAYYASIWGKSAPSGTKTATVHYAKRKRLTVENLEKVLRSFAIGEVGKI